MQCSNHIKKDEEYIYDTEGKKAYCLKHESINSQVTEKSGFGGGKPRSYGTPQRSADDLLQIEMNWLTVILPAIIKTYDENFKELKTEMSVTEWIKINQEIYMDKFGPVTPAIK